MSLTEILNSRYSVRAFKKDPVDSDILQDVFTAAQRSPSNCNVQPWQTYVVSGEKKEELKKITTLKDYHLFVLKNLNELSALSDKGDHHHISSEFELDIDPSYWKPLEEVSGLYITSVGIRKKLQD